jgi:hypothetical protein
MAAVATTTLLEDTTSAGQCDVSIGLALVVVLPIAASKRQLLCKAVRA